MIKEIADWLKSLNISFDIENNLIKYNNIYIKYIDNANPFRDNLHLYRSLLKNNIRLIIIYINEWKLRNVQCKNYIKSILSIVDRRIFARNCQIKEIDKISGNKFIEDNHIQGKNSLGRVFYGLLINDEILGVISLGRHPRTNDNLVLDRLCFKGGVQVVGGASRLFSKCIEYAKHNKFDNIISWSDNRYSQGNVYEKLGFKLDKELNADYCYINEDKKILSKQSCKKTNINCPSHLTEREYMSILGYERIWDCGKKKWIYYIDLSSEIIQQPLITSTKSKTSKTINVVCNYCDKNHEIKIYTYNKNIARNGKYICKIEKSVMAGSKAKTSLIKTNEFAVIGKKKCKNCEEILLLEEFTPDKSRSDGYSNKCKKCRAEYNKNKYYQKKANESN